MILQSHSITLKGSLGKLPNDQKKASTTLVLKRGFIRELQGSLATVASTFPGRVAEQILLETMSK